MPRPTHPYIPTWAGFLFLAIVLDVWSRRIVGWVDGEDLKTEFVLGGARHGDRTATGPNK